MAQDDLLADYRRAQAVLAFRAEIDKIAQMARTQPMDSMPHRALFLKAFRAPDPPARFYALNAWAEAWRPGSSVDAALLSYITHESLPQESRQALAPIISYFLLIMQRPEEAVRAYTCSTLPLPEKTEETKQDTESVTDKFDTLAADYNDLSVMQDVPLQFASFVATALEGRKGLDIFDAACGTGMVGVALREFASRMVGCDISAAMAEQSQGRGVYDEVITADAVATLAERPGSFDVVLCSWAWFYFQDLAPFFQAARAALKPGGLLFGTAYPCTDEYDVRRRTTADFEYTHSRKYLRRIAEESGLETVHLLVREIRYLPGLYGMFRKKD